VRRETDGIDISMATHCSVSDIDLQVINYWSRMFLEDWQNLSVCCRMYGQQHSNKMQMRKHRL